LSGNTGVKKRLVSKYNYRFNGKAQKSKREGGG